MAATWERLGDAVGCVTHRRQPRPDRSGPALDSSPLRTERPRKSSSFSTGRALSWQDEQVYELRPGDCIVHLADHEEHTLRGGPDGLEVLICGTRHPTELGGCPVRGRSALAGPGWRGERMTPGTSRRRRSRSSSVSRRRGLGTSSTSTRRRCCRSRRTTRRWTSATSRARAGPSGPGCGTTSWLRGKLDGEPHCHGA